MPTESSTTSQVNGHVLVIDDSVCVQRLLKAKLCHDGIEIIEALDGETGLEAAKTQTPDAILLDLSMPGMDGFQVLRQLKDEPSTNTIPVLVLSGMQSPQDKVTAFDLGAIDFISKPFDLTELRARVRSALRLSELLKMLSQRAQIDGLTGLYNRAHFDRRWAEELAGAQRHSRPVSIAIIDLDHFKSVNDTFGHPAGDAVIKGLGSLLQEHSRQSDIACRYGGEEFVLILPDTTPSDGAELCDRIRVALGELTWPRHPERQITCSIGIAGASAGTELDAGAVMEAADKLLYRAKKGGRNQCVHSDLSTEPLAKAG